MYFNIILVNAYGILEDEDYSRAGSIYKELKDIDTFNIDDISYNMYYTDTFINNNFKVLYRLLNTIDDGKDITDKLFKCLKFDDVVKIVYHMKRQIINPLVDEIFFKG